MPRNVSRDSGLVDTDGAHERLHFAIGVAARGDHEVIAPRPRIGGFKPAKECVPDRGNNAALVAIDNSGHPEIYCLRCPVDPVPSQFLYSLRAGTGSECHQEKHADSVRHRLQHQLPVFFPREPAHPGRTLARLDESHDALDSLLADVVIQTGLDKSQFAPDGRAFRAFALAGGNVKPSSRTIELRNVHFRPPNPEGMFRYGGHALMGATISD